MKTAAIFGATSAIAIAYARIFASEGGALYLVARNQEKLETLKQDLLVRGASAVNYSVTDLDQIDQHQALFDQIEKTLGTIDLVMIAHGILGDQIRAQSALDEAEAIMRTNFFSAVSLLTIVAQRFESLKHGTIAVISSVAGDRGRQSNYLYGTSKGALNVFLQGLRNRLYKSGVHVLTIKPGFVSTPMTAHLQKGPLFVEPQVVAKDIQRALRWKLNTLYTPWFWLPIMIIINCIPEFIFKRLKL